MLWTLASAGGKRIDSRLSVGLASVAWRERRYLQLPLDGSSFKKQNRPWREHGSHYENRWKLSEFEKKHRNFVSGVFLKVLRKKLFWASFWTWRAWFWAFGLRAFFWRFRFFLRWRAFTSHYISPYKIND